MWDDRWLSGLERVLLVLFVLAVAGELVTLLDWRPGWWEGGWLGIGVAFVLAIARGVLTAGFAACFTVYLIVRYRQRHQTPYPD